MILFSLEREEEEYMILLSLEREERRYIEENVFYWKLSDFYNSWFVIVAVHTNKWSSTYIRCLEIQILLLKMIVKLDLRNCFSIWCCILTEMLFDESRICESGLNIYHKLFGERNSGLLWDQTT